MENWKYKVLKYGKPWHLLAVFYGLIAIVGIIYRTLNG